MHDTPRERASVRRTMLRLLLLASFCLALGTAQRTEAADAPREVHGMSDAIATPDVALAWGILRSTSEATTTVVVRIVTDPAKYGWMGVVGIDPFSMMWNPGGVKWLVCHRLIRPVNPVVRW